MTTTTGGLRVTGGLFISGTGGGGGGGGSPVSTNPPSTTADSPFGAGSSYLFNGLSQYLIYNAAPLAVGTDWTIEWFQKDTGTNEFPRPFMTTGGWGVSIEGAKSGDPAEMYVWTPGANAIASVNRMNAWHHFALSAIGGSVQVYFDGVALGSTLFFSTPSFAGDTLQIGAKPGGSDSESFGGYLTDFRWTDGVGVYTGNFTVPTSELQSTQSSGTNINAIHHGQVKLLVKP